MAFLVVLIIDEPEFCSSILERWEEIGVSGVTILESTGLGRMRRIGERDDLPLMPGLKEILSSREEHHRTLLSVVYDQQTVDRMVAIAQEVIGDLEAPETGFMFVVPVLQVFGESKTKAQSRSS